MGWWQKYKEKAAQRKAELQAREAQRKAEREEKARAEAARQQYAAELEARGVEFPDDYERGWMLLTKGDGNVCPTCREDGGCIWRTKKGYNAYRKEFPCENEKCRCELIKID